MPITRRRLLAGSAAGLAFPALARAQGVDKPRLTAISQWSAGSDGAAISALGKLFEERGGVWQHNPVPGFTTDMMNKLRARGGGHRRPPRSRAPRQLARRGRPTRPAPRRPRLRLAPGPVAGPTVPF